MVAEMAGAMETLSSCCVVSVLSVVVVVWMTAVHPRCSTLYSMWYGQPAEMTAHMLVRHPFRHP